MSDPKLTNSAPESAQTDKTAETVAPAETTQATDSALESRKKKSRKKRIIIISIIAAVVVIAAIVLIVLLTNNNSADAESDEDIEYIDVQTGNYYGGVIEPSARYTSRSATV